MKYTHKNQWHFDNHQLTIGNQACLNPYIEEF